MINILDFSTVFHWSYN